VRHVLGASVHLLLVGLPLLLPGAARTPGVLAFLSLATAFWLAETWARAGRGEAHGDPLAVVSGLGLLAVFWTGLGTTEPVPAWSLVTGAAVMSAGVILRVLAIRELGTWFSSQIGVYGGQPLVMTGPYRRLRHPSETGLLAIALGSAPVLGSAASLVPFALVLLPSVLVRMHREDRVLGEALGEAHARWRRHTGALLPRRSSVG
jgi:protein-S-isoprenylcysteine O-methyltransferase Ste14